MKKIGVIIISGDRDARNIASAVYRRLTRYAQSIARLDVIIFSSSACAPWTFDNLIIRCVSHSSKIFGFWRVVIAGEQLPKPELITTQDPFFLGLAGWFIARHHDIPLELQVHTDAFSPEFQSLSVGNRFRVLLARFLIPRAQHIRVVSERIKQSLIEQEIIDESRITVLPIPISVHPATPSAHYLAQNSDTAWEPRILTVSRLTPEKNLGLAINAFAHLRKINPKATMTIVGDGPLRQSLESQAKKLNLGHSVIFVGNQVDVSPYYTGANVYLCTSKYEGYGLALAEAASFGLPIVSTDVGIVRELTSVIVPSDARKIAEKLATHPSSSKMPDFLKISTDDYTEKIIETWHTFIHLPSSAGSSKHPKPLWIIMKYIISGGAATTVNLGLLYILTNFLRIWYVFSAAIAYLCAFLVSFTLQKFWTFNNSALKQIHTQFMIYVGFVSFNMTLNSLLIYFIVETTGVYYLIAQIGIGILMALWSFAFYRILFTKT